jgi:RNA polymerase sigma-70 factor (ECF subfamily)
MEPVLLGESRAEGAPLTTLGDLLFGKCAKPPAAETEWTALVQRVATGDAQALHALYSRMYRIVFTFVLKITHDRETAEELTVDVFHEVWRRAPAYDPAGGPVVGWIINMARSRAIDRLRFDQRRKRLAIPGEPLTPVDGDDPVGRIAAQEQRRLVRHALTVLTAGERQAIEAAFFSELTYAQVAAQLNEPVGTVKSRIRTGLSKLRRALGKAENCP